MAAASTNLFNFDHIYDPSGYTYSLPRPILDSFLSGKAFDHPHVYTAEDSEAVRADISNLYDAMIATRPVKEREAVLTAGGPGAGKTFLLRAELAKAAAAGSPAAYLDPDDVCLRGLKRTHGADIKASDGSLAAHKAAYDKWRPASNAAHHILTAIAIKEGLKFHFGTTCQSPKTNLFFKHLHAQGYHITVLHVSAPDAVRWASIQERDKTFVQTTEKDIREKGIEVAQRINDTFLSHADTIHFYYRPELDSSPILAATWIRTPDTPTIGTLTVHNPHAYSGVIKVHNAAIDSLPNPDPKLYWEAAVELTSKMTIRS